MLFPRYYGRFFGLMPFVKAENEHEELPERLWEVTIFQTADESWEVTDLTLAADTPLTIEWDGAAPEDVIEGSTATLRVISPGDRTFTDLYTVDPLGVTIEVKADGATVWRGALEPELYEEPYSTRDGYVVELSFADIAGMERIDFALTGRVSFDTILAEAIKGTPLSGYDLRSATMTAEPDGSTLPLDMTRLFISAANFYDEDGKARNMSEAVEMILRPFGLHMRQHRGELRIYDWHSLASDAPGEDRAIEWVDTDAQLSVADVAHAVTLSYSPYADTTLADGSVDIDEIDPDDGDKLTVRLNYDRSDFMQSGGFIDSFKIVSLSPERAATAIPPSMEAHVNLFRITAGHSGSNSAGVLGYCYPRSSILPGGCGVNFVQPDYIDVGSAGCSVLTLTGPWLTITGARSHYLKITLDLLLDVRYNPFEDAGDYNEIGNWNRLKKWANFGYVQCSLEYIGPDGNAVAHYYNGNVVASPHYYDDGNWFAGPDLGGSLWLAYYDPSDRKDSSGFGGWKKNRQSIGRWKNNLPPLFTKRGEGEFVSLKSLENFGSAGSFRLTVYNHILWFDDDGHGEGIGDGSHRLDEIVRWCLFGQTTMEIVRADGSAIDTDDIIYTATAIEGAASDKEVGLEAGSVVKTPTARAVISIGDGASLRPVGPGSFIRTRAAGVEELLLDTLVSQYDEPHVILSGHADLSPVLLDDFCAWSERSQPEGCRFIPTSVTVYAGDGTAEYAFREISPDQYSPST